MQKNNKNIVFVAIIFTVCGKWHIVYVCVRAHAVDNKKCAEHFG